MTLEQDLIGEEDADLLPDEYEDLDDGDLPTSMAEVRGIGALRHAQLACPYCTAACFAFLT